MRKHFLILMLLTLLPFTAWAQVEVTIDPNVINVLYPDNVGNKVPAVTANDFSISGTYPEGMNADQAKASLVAAKILKIQTVGNEDIPSLTGSVKYYFDIDEEKLAASVDWNGASIHLAKNGDLNVIARPLSHESIVITPNSAETGYVNAGYSFVFDATAHQPKPFVTIGAYDANDATNRLVENTDFTYSWKFNTNVNNVPVTPGVATTAGIPTITITAKEGSGYTGSTTFTFDITPKTFYNGNSNVVSINGLTDKTYNRGQAITQDFTVKDTQLNYDMVEGRDYAAVTWANNENATPTPVSDANKASVTISPTGNYATRPNEADNAVGRFIINPKNINEADIVFSGVEDKTYDFGNQLTQVAPALKWKYTDNNQEQYFNIPDIFAYTYTNNVNVGTATITANIATTFVGTEEEVAALQAAAKNYTATAPGKTKDFQIKPKKLNEIADLTITVGEAVYNEGDAVTPTVIVTKGQYNPTDLSNELIAGVDYEIPTVGGWNNNVNVTPNAATDEQKASVTIIGKGNFAAVDAQAQPIKVTQLFTIDPLPVSLTAVGPQGAKPYGTAEADFGFTYTTNLTKVTTMDAFIQKFGGKVTYKPYTNAVTPDVPALINQDFNAINVGTYKVLATWEALNNQALTDQQIAALEPNAPYDTEDQINARANYNFTQDGNVFGTFTIGNAVLIVVPQNAEKLFGVVDAVDPTNPDNNSYSYKVYTNAEDAAAGTNDVVIEFDEKPIYQRVAGEHAGDYTISLANDAEHQPAEANYTVDVTSYPTAIFKINPFPVTITANPQEVLFGTDPNLNSEYNQMVRKVSNTGTQENPVWADGYDNYITTVTISPTQLADETVIKRELGADQMGLGLSLTWNKDIVGENGVYAEALVPVITNTRDYTPTYVLGTLTIKNDAPSIELVRVAKAKIDTEENTAAHYVEQYAGKTVKVNIKYNDADDYNTFKANQWYAMVLPFETDAKMISDAFGYAIVDLIRTSNTDKNRTYFDLHMNTTKIPANTPFIIKAWKDIDMHTTGVTFNSVEIVAPNTDDEGMFTTEQSVDAAGNQFIGTYTGKIGFGGTGSKDYWYSLANGELKQPSSSAYLRQLSAYIKLAPGADPDAHEFIIEELDGTSTVINAIGVETKADGQGIYNLNGMKMQNAPTQKGVYIMNGKKVVIK